MNDRKTCKMIVKAGNCFHLDDIYCNACPLNTQDCDCTKSFGRATQWLKDNPKIKKDFSKITTEQLETAINYYENKKEGNKRKNTVLRDCCMGITCKDCPFYDKEKDVVCSVSNEKIKNAFKKELKKRKEVYWFPKYPEKEKVCDWSNFTTEQLFEAVESYNNKEFGVGTHPCKGLCCPNCPYYNADIIKCDKDFKELHKEHGEELAKRLCIVNDNYVKPPISVKEIVSKWWEIDENVYAKVGTVNTNGGNVLNGDMLFIFEGVADNVTKYFRDGKGKVIRSFVDRDWFEHHESFDFPPEN